MDQFQDKVVLITGAAGGIGKALAQKVSEEGAKLALVDLNLEAVQNIITELGLNEDQALTIAADVANEDQVKSYVDQTVNKYGRIDCFFNNAGVEGTYGNIETQKVDDLDFVFNVNVKGVFLGLKYVVPVMKNQGYGSILNTSSLAGLMGAPGFSPYVASKHAVIGLTRSLANEVTAEGIRVNALCPGVINTRMMRQIEENVAPGGGEEVQKSFTANVPMGRYGEPEEAANVAKFLLSDEASYVSSSIYTVDGGMINQ
ncbi:SDR family NAD(P)-dependent oxidoreductase [Alkalihalobacillus sp. BA299]|uniref:SDR family NAD(P)-dependent oxidoreductase n=1 Tax=Alkalihalobacillus sp. BA299 TaxID=2815938 RepID=UPI001ADA41E3|nr:SDR family NAD(P)-dependent oxidoreductase [Alkalihalobacillus sp. BA299]